MCRGVPTTGTVCQKVFSGFRGRLSGFVGFGAELGAVFGAMFGQSPYHCRPRQGWGQRRHVGKIRSKTAPLSFCPTWHHTKGGIQLAYGQHLYDGNGLSMGLERPIESLTSVLTSQNAYPHPYSWSPPRSRGGGQSFCLRRFCRFDNFFAGKIPVKMA